MLGIVLALGLACSRRSDRSCSWASSARYGDERISVNEVRLGMELGGTKRLVLLDSKSGEGSCAIRDECLAVS